MSANHIETVRQHLLDTLRDLRDRENPMDLDRAKTVAQVATVLVDSARAENEFLKITGGDRSSFVGEQPHRALPVPSPTPTPHNPFPVSARNRA